MIKGIEKSLKKNPDRQYELNANFKKRRFFNVRFRMYKF